MFRVFRVFRGPQTNQFMSGYQKLRFVLLAYFNLVFRRNTWALRNLDHGVVQVRSVVLEWLACTGIWPSGQGSQSV